MDFLERIEKAANIELNSDSNLKLRYDSYNSLLTEAYDNINNPNYLEGMQTILKKVYAFGFELGSNKATEFFSDDYYKPLILRSKELAEVAFKNEPSLLESFMNSVRYNDN